MNSKELAYFPQFKNEISFTSYEKLKRIDYSDQIIARVFKPITTKSKEFEIYITNLKRDKIGIFDISYTIKLNDDKNNLELTIQKNKGRNTIWVYLNNNNCPTYILDLTKSKLAETINFSVTEEGVFVSVENHIKVKVFRFKKNKKLGDNIEVTFIMEEIGKETDDYLCLFKY